MAKKARTRDKPRDPLLRQLHTSAREVYRDDFLWVLDKPAGVLSHPNRGGAKTSNALIRAPYDRELEAFIARVGDRERPVYLVHRLDQETSGLIVCTFQAEAAGVLKEALYHHEVEKEYLALVLGKPKTADGEWRDRLDKQSHGNKIEVRVKRGGTANAETSFRVRRFFAESGLSLLSLSPSTGRTHQLRVQAASRGMPICGDERYGDFTANRFLAKEIGLKHMFLHAHRLVFRHPETGRRMKFQRDPSSRLRDPLERLDSFYLDVPRRRR